METLEQGGRRESGGECFSCGRYSVRSSEVDVIDLVLQIRILKFRKLSNWFRVPQLPNVEIKFQP